MIRKFFKQLLTWQFLKYVAVGLVGTAMDFSLLYLLVEYGHLHYIFGALTSVFIVLWVSFTLNKYWTFKNFEKDYFKQFIKYAISHCIALAVNLIVLATLVEIFHLWYMFAKVFATAAAAVTNFLLVKQYIFMSKKKL